MATMRILKDIENTYSDSTQVNVVGLESDMSKFIKECNKHKIWFYRVCTFFVYQGPWGALRGSEVHDGLVVASGIFLVQQKLGTLLEPFLPLRGVDGVKETEITCQHSVNISIDNSVGQTECDAGDGSSCVIAHAFFMSS